MKRYSFGGGRKLKRSAEIREVLEKGRRAVGENAVAIVLVSSQPLVLSAVIASRKVGKAHERNRAKRLLRESVRMVTERIREGTRIVLIARSSIRGATFEDVRDEVSILLKKLGTFQ